MRLFPYPSLRCLALILGVIRDIGTHNRHFLIQPAHRIRSKFRPKEQTRKRSGLKLGSGDIIALRTRYMPESLFRQVVFVPSNKIRQYAIKKQYVRAL